MLTPQQSTMCVSRNGMLSMYGTCTLLLGLSVTRTVETCLAPMIKASSVPGRTQGRGCHRYDLGHRMTGWLADFSCGGRAEKPSRPSTRLHRWQGGVRERENEQESTAFCTTLEALTQAQIHFPLADFQRLGKCSES